MTRAAAWAARAAAAIVAVAIVSAALAGCGASPAELGPTGVDELTIPTPSPDPADFTGDAANPWFPLVPGTRWTYRQVAPTGSREVVAEVLPGKRDIAGVSTTPVRWQAPTRGRARTVMVRWYAVDRDGNVWWFGQRVGPAGQPLDSLATRSFLAGRNGAEAGLVISAVPRAGDGYLNARQPHEVDRRSTVLSLTGTVATPTKTYHPAVITRDLSELDPLHTVETYFARGTGIVTQQDTSSTSTSLELLRVRRG
jgi:hypothetical protein